MSSVREIPAMGGEVDDSVDDDDDKGEREVCRMSLRWSEHTRLWNSRKR